MVRFGGIFDFEEKRERLQEVELELADGEVWNDPDRAQQLGKERASLEQIVGLLSTLGDSLSDLGELAEMASEENDQTALDEVSTELQSLEGQLATLEFRRMFQGELDGANCYLEIQAGSGGTEAQDWADMLLRMYLRWAERRGFGVAVTEVSEGDVAGIKGATVMISGEYAYGWLRTETGVHRLVRKSPFDSGNRRHTSFASVFVSAEIDDDIEIEINPSDVRLDTYRASGAGGQHVNRTDSAVRLTHLPTNTVVQCQSERSQHQNKDNAYKQLRAKLYELELQQLRSNNRPSKTPKPILAGGAKFVAMFSISPE